MIVLTPCVEFKGARSSGGYGYKRHEGRTVRAHRLAYCTAHQLRLAAIAGLEVRHTCDNPACVNPEHLLLGTHTDNMRDMQERGRNRQPKGEGNAKAKLTEDLVRSIRSLLAQGESHRKIAAAMGVDKSQISRINTGKRWSHV